MRIVEAKAAAGKVDASKKSTNKTGIVRSTPIVIIVAPVSLIDLVKVMIAAAISPLLRKGKVTFLKAVNFEAPNAVAASSYIVGIASNEPINGLTQYEYVNETCAITIIKNPGESMCIPLDPHKKNILNPKAELGITNGISINRSKIPLTFLFFIFDIISAIGVAITILINVTIRAISIDVPKARKISVNFRSGAWKT